VGKEGSVNYLPSPYGEVYRWFVREYVPAHPRSYTFQDIRPEIAIVRFDDSYWGQNHSPFPRKLYGGRDEADAASLSWINIWRLLTHGQTSSLGISRWNSGWEGKRHDFFCALNGVAVYDHLAQAEQFKDVRLIFLTGIMVSDGTLKAITNAVKEGAVCIALKSLAQAQCGKGPVVQDGKGAWVLTDNFLDSDARRAATPFLGKPDEIRYRFGDKILTVKRGKDGNDINILLGNISC
jgi:hypothetical protein